MWPKGQWCEETQFVSVVHDSCKGNGLVVGGAALHSCAGIRIFPVSLLQWEGHHLCLCGCSQERSLGEQEHEAAVPV